MAASSRLSGKRDKKPTAVRAKADSDCQRGIVRRFRLLDHILYEDGEKHQRLGWGDQKKSYLSSIDFWSCRLAKAVALFCDLLKQFVHIILRILTVETGLKKIKNMYIFKSAALKFTRWCLRGSLNSLTTFCYSECCLLQLSTLAR